jgi:hypothetical protein
MKDFYKRVYFGYSGFSILFCFDEIGLIIGFGEVIIHVSDSRSEHIETAEFKPNFVDYRDCHEKAGNKEFYLLTCLASFEDREEFVF